MKYKHLLFLPLMFLFTVCSPDPVETTGSISGTIRDALNNEPLAGASVTLTLGDGKVSEGTISPTHSITTGNNGEYKFTDLEMGEYTISVKKADYEPDSRKTSVLVKQNTQLDFSLRRAASALEVSPLTLDFGATNTQLNLNVKNIGQATMTWQITENTAWFSCSPTTGTVLAGKTGSLAVTVDRTGLSKGAYTNTFVITSNDGGSTTVTVNMTVSSEGGGLPQVAMIGVDGKTDVSATFIGALTSIGSSRVTAHGFCWSTRSTPTLEQGQHCDLGQTDEPKDNFTYGASGLQPNTTYYVRAYATNAEGTVYSSREESFTTEATPQRPEVETGAASQITSTTAVVNGNILKLGHETGILAYGHVWSDEMREPTTDYSNTELGRTTQTGSFQSQLKSLKPGTKYYVRAYARNQYGTNYGQTVEFTTAVGDVQLTTHSASDIIHNEATCGGRIIDLQGNAVQERGVCWSTSSNPTRAHNYRASSDMTDDFSVRMTGLTERTVYHVRAYVVAATGEAYYGQDVLFQTTHEIRLPQASGTTISGIGVNSVTLRASVTNDGDGTISDAGFCYATTPNPSTADNKASCGATTSSFSKTLSDLQENTRYYVRAYVTNERGTNYGDQTEFTTLEVSPPSLSAVTASGVTFRSATFAATVTSLGNGTLKRSGFCYATTPGPTTTHHRIDCGTATTLRGSTSSLTANTTYYVRAFAENEKGTAYGPELTITTKEEPDGTKIGLDDYPDDSQW